MITACWGVVVGAWGVQVHGCVCWHISMQTMHTWIKQEAADSAESVLTIACKQLVSGGDACSVQVGTGPHDAHA